VDGQLFKSLLDSPAFNQSTAVVKRVGAVMSRPELVSIPGEVRRVTREMDGLLATVARAGPEGDPVLAKFEAELAEATEMMHGALSGYFRRKAKGMLTLR
jgi:hypothetical protein